MSKMQREKGKRFERLIAAKLRERWPDALVRRASQAERADNPDVFVEGGPGILSKLWLELTDARAPVVSSKLEQASNDAADWFLSVRGRGHRYPVVIWHRIGERAINVTLRLWALNAIMKPDHPDGGWMTRVTMPLDDFLDVLDAAEIGP